MKDVPHGGYRPDGSTGGGGLVDLRPQAFTPAPVIPASGAGELSTFSAAPQVPQASLSSLGGEFTPVRAETRRGGSFSTVSSQRGENTSVTEGSRDSKDEKAATGLSNLPTDGRPDAPSTNPQADTADPDKSQLNSVECEPITLRGHHLANAKRIIRGATTPEGHAAGVRRSASQRKRIGYARDVLGNAEESAQVFEQGLAQLGRRIRDLPDSHPIILVARQDDICQGCYIGQHCREPDGIEMDTLLVNEFVFQAEAHGLQEQLDIQQETLPGASQKIAPVIRTNLGVVRTVLRRDTGFF